LARSVRFERPHEGVDALDVMGVIALELHDQAKNSSNAAVSRMNAQNSAIWPSAFMRYLSTPRWSKRLPSREWFQ
jgi:hypothetical protein